MRIYLIIACYELYPSPLSWSWSAISQNFYRSPSIIPTFANPPPRPNPSIFYIYAKTTSSHVQLLGSAPPFQSRHASGSLSSWFARSMRRGYQIAIHPRISLGIKWLRIGLFHGWPAVAASLARPPLAKVVRYVARVTLHTTKVGEWTEKSMASSSPPRLRFSTFVSRLISRELAFASQRRVHSRVKFQQFILLKCKCTMSKNFIRQISIPSLYSMAKEWERVKTTPERTNTSTGITFDRETVDEPISSSARYRFTASHPQVQHALTSDFRRAYNSSCALFRDSFIIRNGTRDRSFDLLPPLEPFEGCEERDRSFALSFEHFGNGLIRCDWNRSAMESFQIILRHVRCFEIANVERIWIHAITYNFLELI